MKTAHSADAAILLEQARERLAGFLGKLDASARKFEERRAERRGRGSSAAD